MWGDLVLESLRRPRLAARRILDAEPPDGALIEAALLVTCAGIVLGYLALRAAPDGIDMVSAAILANPLLGAAAQLGAMVVVIFLTVRIGRLFGGQGATRGAAALVIWLNGLLVLVQVVQLVALALMPPLAALLAIAATIWAIWAFANFVAELHGFRNPFIVLGATMLTGLMLFFATAMLLAILGITPQEVG